MTWSGSLTAMSRCSVFFERVGSGQWCPSCAAKLKAWILSMGLLRLDKLGYDAHMIADRFPQRGMFDVKAPGSVGFGGEAH